MVISVPLKFSPKTEIRRYLQKKYGNDVGIKWISCVSKPIGNFAEFIIFFFQDRYNFERKVSALVTRSTILFEEIEIMH
ncbi:MAG: hypothetical protein GWO87_02800 [Xanthomonadaceae bacterium]|nr:hypothetical protein [Rhodospirillaceae bacterium]NIA18090.1 hypothetical protein [Xanthomonadaceae bacterium]